MHKKFDSLWTGPYQIMSKAGLNSFNLATLEGEKLKLPVNMQAFSSPTSLMGHDFLR
jgi:hypothetical protein